MVLHKPSYNFCKVLLFITYHLSLTFFVSGQAQHAFNFFPSFTGGGGVISVLGAAAASDSDIVENYSVGLLFFVYSPKNKTHSREIDKYKIKHMIDYYAIFFFQKI